MNSKLINIEYTIKEFFSLLKDEEKQKITNIFIDKILIDYNNWKMNKKIIFNND